VLKRRLIPCLFLQNGLIVRSQGFHQWKALGNPISQLERLNEWNADELIYVDITRDGDYDLRRDDLKAASRSDILSILRDVALRCFMPLTFGGRIRSLETADTFIANGADKVVINSGAHRDPSLIDAVARKYGAQAMVLGVDVRREASGGWAVYADNGRTRTDVSLDDWLRQGVDRGAGEIFLSSIDRDGSAEGYDLDLVRHVCERVAVPVIACGGAGVFEHFVDVLRHTSASAAAAGNIFNFTENAYRRAKRLLHEEGIDVR
jgi:imidazole glycerol-phosphate synthase subunit HisF